jgi:DNA-binding transcriptional LysR family regulator
MRLEWLEDILAILDCGTLTRAAEARLLTQPAFSRRFRTIEEHLGVDLIDRARRPARLKPSVLAQEDRIRELASGLRQLVRELQRSDAALRSRVVIASQHAITTAVAPHVLRNFLPSSVSFRLRSANREECYALVMMRQADLALCYQTPGDRFGAVDAMLEELDLGTERFIPVFSRVELDTLEESCSRGECPVISYPRDVFLGRRLEQEILPRMPPSLTLVRRAETALTPAALQLALVGVGVSWVPQSLAERPIASGTLADLSSWLPSSRLSVTALRPDVPGDRSDAEEMVWARLAQLGDLALLTRPPP